MKTHLVIAVSGMLLCPLIAAETDSAELKNPIPDTMVPQAEIADVPEPSSLFFAGIGSLAILFFAIRRK